MDNYEEAGTFTSAFREDAKLQTCCSITVHLKSRCLSSSQVLLVFGRKKKWNQTQCFQQHRERIVFRPKTRKKFA